MARKKNRKGKNNNNKNQPATSRVNTLEDPVIEDTPLADTTTSMIVGNNAISEGDADDTSSSIKEKEKDDELTQQETAIEEDDLNASPLDNKDEIPNESVYQNDEENTPQATGQTERVELDQEEEELDLNKQVDQHNLETNDHDDDDILLGQEDKPTGTSIEDVQLPIETGIAADIEPKPVEDQLDDPLDFNESKSVEEHLPVTLNNSDSIVDDLENQLENDEDEEFVDDQDMPSLTENRDENTHDKPATTTEEKEPVLSTEEDRSVTVTDPNEPASKSTVPTTETVSESTDNGSDDEFNFVTPEVGVLEDNNTSQIVENEVSDPKDQILDDLNQTFTSEAATRNQTFVTANEQSPAPPPLPVRNINAEGEEEQLSDTSMDDIPLSFSTGNVSKSMPLPKLPPRNHHSPNSASAPPPAPKNAVPPPLSEELKSPEFRKNLELINEKTSHDHKHKMLKNRLISNTYLAQTFARQASAADINLIVNRFIETSVQIDEIQPSVREDIEVGHDILKSSFGLLMTHGEDLKENLLNKDLPTEKSNPEEARELQEVTDADWTFWARVVNDFASVANKESEQLEREITKGIPRQIRGIIWQLIANSKSKEMEDIYETLSTIESPHESNIRRDLKRTNFIPEDRLEELFLVLKVYSLYDPDVGYTQGMAFITTPLLLNCNSEAETFGLLVSLMKYYHLRQLYLPDMPGLMLMLYQFDRLLEENTPNLATHLTREGIRSSMYATQWFLTIFAYKFPLEFVLKIFDIIFFEGIESLLKFAVNLMIKNENILINLEFDQLLSYLKNELFNIYLKDDDEGNSLEKTLNSSNTQLHDDTHHGMDYNAHLFVYDAIKDIIITPISLNRYSAEYDSINAIEKRRETEYDSMKIKNEELYRERNKLQHDYHELNEEHITVAKELIQYRLDIETLLDENNDLKDNLDSLNEQLNEEINKSTVPNPDADLPVDLKQDLERTMKRNTEVTALNKVYQERISQLEETIKELKTVNSSLNVANVPGDIDGQTTSGPSPATKSVSPEREDSGAGPSSFSSGWSRFKKVLKK